MKKWLVGSQVTPTLREKDGLAETLEFPTMDRAAHWHCAEARPPIE